jgi:uncharacterized protein (DUF2141 family)
MAELQQSAQAQNLKINIENIVTSGGSIYISVYDRSEAFMDVAKALDKRVIAVKAKGSVSLNLTGLKAGDYAISCYHDLNDNGKLDSNFLGIPTEPYAFSNNTRPKFRAPNWEEARFAYTGGDAMVNLRLEKW